MDDEIRRREAERQGRQAYQQGRERNPLWPTDFLAAFDRAAAEDEEDRAAADSSLREYTRRGGIRLEDFQKEEP